MAMRLVIIGAVSLFSIVPGAPAAAHPVPFSYIDLRVQPSAAELSIVVHTFDVAHDLKIQPPERLLEGDALAGKADALTKLLHDRLSLSAGGVALRNAAWSAPEAIADRQSI